MDAEHDKTSESKNLDSGIQVRRVPAILVFVASLLLALIMLEVASRLLIPNRYYVWPPNFSTTFDAGDVIAGVAFPSQLTINAAGMRGALPVDSHEYRILAVGGSTTICVYLDDSTAWPHLVKERMNAALGREAVWVGNVGRPGHRTVQNILQVDKLLGQHPEIDMVVLLEGINDLITDLSFNNSVRQAATEDLRQNLAMSFSFFPGWDDSTPWYERNLLGRIRALSAWRPLPGVGKLQPMDAKGEFVAALRSYRQAAGHFRSRLPDLSAERDEYAARLNEIVDIAERRGVRVLFLTQPTLWDENLSAEDRKLVWAGGPPLHRLRKGAAYFSLDALARAMKSYNETLLEVCRERGVECIDAASRMKRSSEYLYDDAHFTDRGAATLAGWITDHLLETGPLRR